MPSELLPLAAFLLGAGVQFRASISAFEVKGKSNFHLVLSSQEKTCSPHLPGQNMSCSLSFFGVIAGWWACDLAGGSIPREKKKGKLLVLGNLWLLSECGFTCH